MAGARALGNGRGVSEAGGHARAEDRSDHDRGRRPADRGRGRVLFATLSDDSYRRLASYLFERATGRTLIVDGRFAVHPSLRPSLVVSHVRIPNPAWASTPEFAQIGHMEIEVALPSLLSGAAGRPRG